MKLIIVRHAKSSWDFPSMRDHDRPLAPRGERAASVIGRWLAEEGHQPASVLCSTAARARQTWELMRPHFNEPREIRFTAKLYHADRNQIWAQVQGSGLSPLLVVGHNPGIGDFAASAAGRAPDREEFSRYPTAAVTVCEFAADSWRRARIGTGNVTGFTVPRDHS